MMQMWPRACRLAILLSQQLYILNLEECTLPLYTYIHTGCLKKNAPLCLTGHRGYQKWTLNKSRVSFEKFRKFPF